MPAQKRKPDDFRRAANKPGQRKIRFNTRSRLLELCAAPSEQVKNLSATLLEDNDTTNDHQNTEMQTLSQSERATFAKAKTLPSEEIRKAISQSTTNESQPDTESIIENRKIYDLADFISKSYGGKEKHNVQSLNKDENTSVSLNQRNVSTLKA